VPPPPHHETQLTNYNKVQSRMVTTSPHGAVAANASNASTNDTTFPPSTSDAPLDIHIDTGNQRWWDLDRSGLAAAAAAATGADPSVLLPFLQDADADASDNVDPDEDDCSHDHTFARIVSPEASSIYSGMPDAIPSIIDDIRAMLQEAWNISEPKEWQLNAIFAMVYGLDRAFRRLLLVRRTGDGKSLVIYGLATLLRGVTFVLVPILALGSDQVSSVWSMVNPLAGVFAEHLDSIRERGDIVSMARFLKSLRHKDKYGQSIVLWVSPDTLDNDVWKLCIKSLMQNHLVSCFVVDECHYIPTDGRFFRPKFHSSVRRLVNDLWDSTPMLFCSATFNRPLQYHTSVMLHPSCPSINAISSSLGLDGTDIVVPDAPNFGLPSPFFTSTIHGDLGRTGININIVLSNEWKSSFSEMDPYLRNGLQVMVYCQSAGMAVDKVKPFAKEYLASIGMHDSDTMSLTGGDGIMMKSFLVDLFAGKIESDVCKLSIIVGTSAMNCGISSKLLHFLLFIGFPRRMSELVQTLGRLFRGPPPRLQQDTIKWVLSLANFIILFQTSASNVDTTERSRQLYELKQVIRFLLLPSECYHITMERYYSHRDSTFMEPCSVHCPYCRGDHLKFCTTVRREVFVDYLYSTVFIDGPVSLPTLSTMVYKKRASIWVASLKNVPSGQVHALLLQLWAAGILELRMRSIPPPQDGPKTAKIKPTIMCRWAVGPETDAIRMKNRDLSLWAGINTI
jgi:hypothetical protein